jgi:hypothetical protein
MEKCTEVSGRPCTKVRGLYPVIDMTTDGDETVLVPSALDMATSTDGVERWWVNLAKHNEWGQFNRNRNHGNTLEILSVQQLIKNLINEEESPVTYIEKNALTDKNISNRLRFRLDSPASLDMYDTEGNHTGIIPSPIPNSDLRYYEHNIPNSYYFEFAGSKYSGVSSDATSTLKLIGEETGTISLTVDEVSGDNTSVASSTYKDIPIRQNTKIEINIQNLKTADPLKVDLNGDGTFDFSISQNEVNNPLTYIKQIRAFVETVQFKNKGIKTAYLAHLTAMEKLLAKKQKIPITAIIKGIEIEIRIHIKAKLINETDGKTLISLFERLKEMIIK